MWEEETNFRQYHIVVLRLKRTPGSTFFLTFHLLHVHMYGRIQNTDRYPVDYRTTPCITLLSLGYMVTYLHMCSRLPLGTIL